MRCELRSAAPRDVLKGTPEFNSVSLHRSIEGNTSYEHARTRTFRTCYNFRVQGTDNNIYISN